MKSAEELVEEGNWADLLVGNYVLAHVPDLNYFFKGLKVLLSPQVVITIVFPLLKNLIECNNFDTIYHEHFSYFSLLTVETVFAEFDLTIFDVEEIPTHGGSLRINARHKSDKTKPNHNSVDNKTNQEKKAGYRDNRINTTFAEQVKETKRKLQSLLIEAKRQ